MPYNVLPKFQGKTVDEIRESIKRFPFSIASFNVKYGINVGSILRACNVFAATQYINIGDKQWDRRASLGVQNYENIIYTPTWKDALALFKEKRLIPFAVDYIEGRSYPIHRIEAYKNMHPVFIFGSERGGLPEDVVEDCEMAIHIEQYGSIPSMNVGQAAAVIMNHWHECYRKNN